MRTIAAKFPQYRFEELLDKTPAWLEWVLLQAVNLDLDLMKKAGMILGGAPPGPGTGAGNKTTAPQGRLEEFKEMKRLGLNVRRDK